LDPQKVPAESLTPRVLLEAVVADGKELMPTAAGGWQAPSGVRRFEFDYTAPDLTLQRNMRFRHKLDGMDHDWVDAGAQRVAYYSQLPPGQYQFHVMVGGSDNRWHAAVEVVQLRHRAAPLGASLVAGAGQCPVRRHSAVAAWAGASGAGYRLRLERLRMQNAMEDERRRIARDLHDEFGSSLSGIAVAG